MHPVKKLLLMMALTLMWSPSFLFIKLAVQDLPPLTIVSLRVTIASIFLLGILWFTGRRLPKSLSFWAITLGMALFSSIIPFTLFCYAEKSIDSALAALLNGTTPMFTALLAQYFVPSDRLDMQKLVGILLSTVGIVLLFSPQLMEGVDGTSIGMLAALVGSISYSISHIYGKLYTTGHTAYVAPTAQFLASAVTLWPIACWHDQIWTLPFPSYSSILGVCCLALFGTVIAFIIYYKLLEHCGPTAVSTVACFFPVGGMLLGCLFLEETFTFFNLIAALTILAGMLTVNNIIPINFFTRRNLKSKDSPQTDSTPVSQEPNI